MHRIHLTLSTCLCFVSLLHKQISSAQSLPWHLTHLAKEVLLLWTSSPHRRNFILYLAYQHRYAFATRAGDFFSRLLNNTMVAATPQKWPGCGSLDGSLRFAFRCIYSTVWMCLFKVSTHHPTTREQPQLLSWATARVNCWTFTPRFRRLWLRAHTESPPAAWWVHNTSARCLNYGFVQEKGQGKEDEPLWFCTRFPAK